MENDEKKKSILDFIKKHRLAVLATTSPENKPEAAVIEFSEKDNFELIFDTFSTFRKYKNIQLNSDVAVVIGRDDITVQYEGEVVELKGDELKEYQKIHITKLPDSSKFVEMEDIKFFKIIPKWIRYTDVSVSPWKEFEITF